MSTHNHRQPFELCDYRGIAFDIWPNFQISRPSAEDHLPNCGRLQRPYELPVLSANGSHPLTRSLPSIPPPTPFSKTLLPSTHSPTVCHPSIDPMCNYHPPTHCIIYYPAVSQLHNLPLPIHPLYVLTHQSTSCITYSSQMPVLSQQSLITRHKPIRLFFACQFSSMFTRPM